KRGTTSSDEKETEMSGNNNVTATVTNTSDYTLTYATQNVDWGYLTINSNTIDARATIQAFYAVGADGAATGCSGSATYSFTDGDGNTQNVTFFYDDPYTGSNSFNTTVPPGMRDRKSVV